MKNELMLGGVNLYEILCIKEERNGFKIKQIHWKEIRGNEQRKGMLPCLRKVD